LEETRQGCINRTKQFKNGQSFISIENGFVRETEKYGMILLLYILDLIIQFIVGGHPNENSQVIYLITQMNWSNILKKIQSLDINN
jgi:hypothetical protein